MPRRPGKFISVGSDEGKRKKTGVFKQSDGGNEQRRERGLWVSAIRRWLRIRGRTQVGVRTSKRGQGLDGKCREEKR